MSLSIKINWTYTLTIAGALFDGNNLPAPKNPAFLRRIDPKTLAAMILTSRHCSDSTQRSEQL